MAGTLEIAGEITVAWLQAVAMAAQAMSAQNLSDTRVQLAKLTAEEVALFYRKVYTEINSCNMGK
jgi:hypothetical protein